MALSYKRLFKLLIDLNIRKSKLIEITNISESTMAKLVKGKNVNTQILERICSALRCKIEDIVEYVGEETK
jgi:DNA-binding Xre family transcriptional regulator